MTDKLHTAIAYLGTNWVLHPKTTYKPKWRSYKTIPNKPFLSWERL